MLKKLIHIDNFHQDVKTLSNVIHNLEFKEAELGLEIPEFNLCIPNLSPIFKEIINEDLVVDEERSGVFRKPSSFIHFESFEHPLDWCMGIAIDPIEFNICEMIDGPKTALEGHNVNYRDLMQWDIKTNVHLRPNDCILFRPWLFHSFSGQAINSVMQMYYLRHIL